MAGDKTLGIIGKSFLFNIRTKLRHRCERSGVILLRCQEGRGRNTRQGSLEKGHLALNEVGC
jgi:hypothetical protein